MRLRVWWVRDPDTLDLFGDAVVDDRGVVRLTGFGAGEAEHWTQHGLRVGSPAGWFQVPITWGEVFLQALAWTYAGASRLRVVPDGFTIWPIDRLVKALRDQTGTGRLVLTGGRGTPPTVDEVVRAYEALTGRRLTPEEVAAMRARRAAFLADRSGTT